MAKTLEMVFTDAAGKDIVISLLDPKDDLTATQVQTVMQDIVARNIFATKNGDLTAAGSARIRSREVTALA